MTSPLIASPPIFTIDGGEALSDFRLEKYRAFFAEHAINIGSISTQYLYAIAASRALTQDEHVILLKLLNDEANVKVQARQADSAKSASKTASLLVMPRLGTISPWATKATDIALNCGLDAVTLIERTTVFYIENFDHVTNHARDIVVAHLHDPMTETVRYSADDIAQLFIADAAAPLTTINLLAQGKAALTAANQTLGLALSIEEIDYLFDYYAAIKRDPTDVELMMFAQANSEHCRHKIFNASWTIDGVAKDKSLFAMIRHTHQVSPAKTIVAYSDNCAVMQGAVVDRFYPALNTQYQFSRQTTHVLMKVETHNHPTAIAPWAGAATGAGGEIRDEGATGTGAKPKAGLTGFSVSNLNIPGHVQPWEIDYGKPARIAAALNIMTEGPIGGAAFNNEFGRINLCGYFRTYEQLFAGTVRGYHKPIMIAGGLGSISDIHTHKKMLSAGTLLIQLGGPGMRIGLGGGAASSVASGTNTESLDFDSVQRANPEMQRRCQEVIDACWQRGGNNPILSIHDVGAGGISNALPELAHTGGVGATFNLRAVPSLEAGMSPKEIWSNESQERYVLAIHPDSLALFSQLCERERCPFAVVGEATSTQQLIVEDPLFNNNAVEMDMDVLLGKPPRMHRDVVTVDVVSETFTTDAIDVKEALYRILHLPTVADKSFLITIGDRSVGGLTARDQLVGPWQVAVADCAVTLMGYNGIEGEAMAMGERAPIALLDAPASARMAVGEAITNIVAADVGQISDIKLSANWMAACGVAGEDAKLFAAVEAIGMVLCPALGISIPVGKDSLSMKSAWTDRGSDKSVVAPVSLVISAFAVVEDASQTLTPVLSNAPDTELLLIDLGKGKNRLGASSLAQVYNQVGSVPPDLDDATSLKNFFSAIRTLAKHKKILAYHDRSDGGLIATVAEMMFAGHIGVTLTLDTLVYNEKETDVDDYDNTATSMKLGDNAHIVAALFNEELGAVIQIRRADRQSVMQTLRDANLSKHATIIGHTNASDSLRLIRGAKPILDEPRIALHRAWSHTSFLMQSRRDNPGTARQEYDRLLNAKDTGLFAKINVEANDNIVAPLMLQLTKPKIAILREQGVNGQTEMAHAFVKAGFDAYDVHMSDIISGQVALKDFQGLAACGGFSYGDVLGAGAGWAKSILFNARALDEFSQFFQRDDVFSLGVCNGCQMMSHLSSIIPGAENWPKFARNKSEQYEARTVLLEIRRSPSILFSGMEGAIIPVPTAHGEGQAVFRNIDQQNASRWLAAAHFVDYAGHATENFPANPNGSPLGMTAFTTPDGRFNIMMPHPERAVLSANLSWHPPEWQGASPWLRMFQNARVWVS